MASFGSTDLGDQGSAVFELTSTSDSWDFTCQLDDGSIIIIPSSSKHIIVRNCPPGDFDYVHRQTREAANRGIDLYFCQGGPSTGIAHRDSSYIVRFQNKAQQAVIRVVARALITTRFGAKVETRSLEGAVISAHSRATPQWDSSLRYYRMSESSGDLYDSFRNLYLGLEALLSTVVPPQMKLDGTPENESKWLTRALKMVGQNFDLSLYAPASSKKTCYNAIHDELYTSLRTAIFHAKAGRLVWQPQDWSSRDLVIEARSRYSEMFRALATGYFNAVFASGRFVKAYWQNVNEEILKGHAVFVSNDPTRVEDEPGPDYLVAPSGGESCLLPTIPAADMAADWRRGVQGIATGSKILESVSDIRRIGTVAGGRVAIVESLMAPLMLDQSEELQVVVLVEGRNYGAPRQDFES